MNPDFRLYERIDLVKAECNIEETFAKMRWDEKKKEKEKKEFSHVIF